MSSTPGDQSVAKRMLRCAASWLSSPPISKLFTSAETSAALEDALKQAKGCSSLLKLGKAVMRKATRLKVTFCVLHDDRLYTVSTR